MKIKAKDLQIGDHFTAKFAVGYFYEDRGEPHDLFVTIDYEPTDTPKDNMFGEYERNILDESGMLTVIRPRIRIIDDQIVLGQDKLAEPKFSFKYKCTCETYFNCDGVCRCGAQDQYAKTFIPSNDIDSLIGSQIDYIVEKIDLSYFNCPWQTTPHGASLDIVKSGIIGLYRSGPKLFNYHLDHPYHGMSGASIINDDVYKDCL